MAARAKFTHALNRLKAVGSLSAEQFDELKALQKAKDPRVTEHLYPALGVKGEKDELSRLRGAIETTMGWKLSVPEVKEDEDLHISRDMANDPALYQAEEDEADVRRQHATEDKSKRQTVPLPEH